MKLKFSALLAIVLATECAYGQTTLDLRSQTRNVDFSGAASTRPFKTGATLPASCGVGDMFFLTTAPAGQNLFSCSTVNTWSAVSTAPLSSFSQISGVAAVTQGGTGATTAAAALGTLGAAPVVHTHAITDLIGISGKHGTVGLLQAFGGGTVNTNDCAKFDSLGNLVSAGGACGTSGTSSVFGRYGVVTAQSGDYSFPLIAGTAAITQGGTGATTAAAALTNLGAAPVVHTHVLTNLIGITGKQGSGSLLQAFGGGTVNTNDCAKFDASGNLVTAGSPCNSNAAALQGNSLDAGTPDAAGQFYGWNPTTNTMSLFTPGPLLSVTGKIIDVATDSVPLYTNSDTLPSSCSQYGLFYFLTSATPGNKLYYCNGAAYEGITSGLSDPGASGLLKRTALNTTAAAVSGVDYYAPGAAIAATDLPNPTSTTGGKVQAKSCAGGAFVNSVNTDSSVTCATPAAGLSDPGSNGILARTAAGVTVARTLTAGSTNISIVAGDGSANPAIDLGTTVDLSTKKTLPNQVGAIDALPSTCTVGQTFFSTSAASGQNMYFCTAANTWTQTASGSGIQATQSNTFSPGMKQIFQPSTSTAGLQISCGALPSSPATGDIACDSSDANKAKQWNGTSWLSLGFSGTGLADPGASGIVVRTSPGSTAARTLVAGSSNISISGGDGSSNPAIDIGTTVNFSSRSTLPNQVGAVSGLPATCSVGQTYFSTTAAAGQNMYYCTAANTWTQESGTGGGGGSTGSKLIQSLYPATTITMTGSDVNLFSPITVPAMPGGQCLRLQMGRLTHNGGTSTITYRAKLNGTSIGTSIGASSAATSGYLFGTVCADSTGANVVWFSIAAPILGAGLGGSSAITTTGSNTFVLTASGTAGDTVLVQDIMVEVVQ